MSRCRECGKPEDLESPLIDGVCDDCLRKLAKRLHGTTGNGTDGFTAPRYLKQFLASIIGAVAGGFATGGIQAWKSAWLSDTHFRQNVSVAAVCGAVLGCTVSLLISTNAGKVRRNVGLGKWLLVAAAIALMVALDLLGGRKTPFGRSSSWYFLFLPFVIGGFVGRLFGDRREDPQEWPASRRNLPDTQPLATYEESFRGDDRKFELYADRVIILKREPAEISEVPIMLRDLHPPPTTRRKDKLYSGAFLGWAVRAAIYWIMAAFMLFGIGLRLPWWAHFAWVGVAILSTAIACQRFFSRIPWIQYRNHAGTTVLDFYRAGPECEHFDAFATALELQILAARRPETH